MAELLEERFEALEFGIGRAGAVPQIILFSVILLSFS